MGSFGETGTKATWANPQVTPEAQRQSGGWYYNPASGSVDRWWSGGGTTTPTAQAAVSGGGSYQPKSFEDTLSSIAGKVSEAYKPSTDVLTTGLQKTEAATLEREKLAREELPIIQQRYKTLLDELNTKSEEAQADIKGVGNAAIGETRARAGATGIYSSGIELGQEANIGALTAKTLRQAAGDYETNKQKYLGMQSQEELNLKKNILDIVSTGDEASLKLRQAIAAIGPEKLNTSITLAAQILAQDRAESELGIKFSEEARAEALFPLQKEKLKKEIFQIGKATENEKKASAAQSASNDAVTGMSVDKLANKYAKDLSAEEIAKIWTAVNPSVSKYDYPAWVQSAVGVSAKPQAGDTKVVNGETLEWDELRKDWKPVKKVTKQPNWLEKLIRKE